jgi:tRNA (cmo5U34)-methyltransferase
MFHKPNVSQSTFSDPQAVARYAEGPPRLVPGFGDLHRMAALLLAERVPENGRVLVVGAGGGLELKTFAESHPTWTFDGVDPSREMLELARQTLGLSNSRVRLQQGHIDKASEGPFDGATCLLTMHHIPLAERKHTLTEIHHRLKRGAPFVVAHMSIPLGEWERKIWFSRYAAFAVSSGIESDKAESGRAAVESRLDILSPEQDEMLLREAGFSKTSQFYAGFTFRGWVAYA